MKKPVNIMHLVFNLDVGGLEWVSINLLHGLNRERFRPVLGCLMNGGRLVQEAQNRGIEVEILNKLNKIDFSVSWRLAKIMRKRKIDILHTHNTGAFLYGTIAAKLARVSAIVHTEHGRNFPDKKRLMVAEKVLSMFTSKIVTVSEELKTALIEFEKISPEKIAVIPNGIDLALFKTLSDGEKQQKRSNFGLNQGDFVIGNIGRLVEVKDHQNLIKAFNFIQREIPQAKLVIVGDGPLKKSLMFNVECLNLKDKVRFLGERQDIPELLNVFDVFVLPSKSEGLSLTLLEAMAAKKAIVATAVGGNKEIIDDKVDGYLVDAKNPQELSKAILEIANNPQKSEKLSNAAYQKISAKYSLEKMLADYQNIYEASLFRN